MVFKWSIGAFLCYLDTDCATGMVRERHSSAPDVSDRQFSLNSLSIFLSLFRSVCHHQVRRTASSLIHRKGCSRLERSELGSTSSIAASTSALNEGPGFPTVHAFTTRSPWR